MRPYPGYDHHVHRHCAACRHVGHFSQWLGNHVCLVVAHIWHWRRRRISHDQYHSYGRYPWHKHKPRRQAASRAKCSPCLPYARLGPAHQPSGPYHPSPNLPCWREPTKSLHHIPSAFLSPSLQSSFLAFSIFGSSNSRTSINPLRRARNDPTSPATIYILFVSSVSTTDIVSCDIFVLVLQRLPLLRNQIFRNVFLKPVTSSSDQVLTLWLNNMVNVGCE